MLRMQPFHVEFPTSLNEAVELLQSNLGQAKLCAGGTDLLPNLKHELLSPKTLVHLSRIRELSVIAESNGAIEIGALTTLDTLSEDEILKTKVPALVSAATQVAGPQLRRMGTIGGNLCLDTRCLYFNQSFFWREALGFCLKKDGDTCHVTKTGKRCVAAASNDCATVLIALDASVDLISSKGLRTLSLNDFYVANGEKNTVLFEDEILTKIHIPKKSEAGTRRLQGFAKLRHRESIDFPMLSIAVRFDLNSKDELVDSCVVVNALAAKPKVIQTAWLKDRQLNDTLIDELADYAAARCMPLSNICDDSSWRKEMVSVYLKRACETLK